MKDIILKWLEVKRIKYEKLYCKHDWEKKDSWDITDIYTKARREGAITLYVCKKCGKLKKVEL